MKRPYCPSAKSRFQSREYVLSGRVTRKTHGGKRREQRLLRESVRDWRVRPVGVAE